MTPLILFTLSALIGADKPVETTGATSAHTPIEGSRTSEVYTLQGTTRTHQKFCTAPLSSDKSASFSTQNLDKTMNKSTNEPIMGLGDPVSANFTGAAWLNMLSAQPAYDCNVYNVTFAPGARNDWHRHSIGQILLCTKGTGYYQERGKSARRLQTGDVVQIPAGAIHWHGAAPDSRFTHIGITPKVTDNAVEWLHPVTDDEYQQAVQAAITTKE